MLAGKFDMGMRIILAAHTPRNATTSRMKPCGGDADNGRGSANADQHWWSSGQAVRCKR